MANCDIIARLASILDDYEAGRVRPEDLERSIPGHIEALEALPYQRIREARRLCYRLVTAHIFVGEEEYIGAEDVAKVLADFRAFVASLPGADKERGVEPC